MLSRVKLSFAELKNAIIGVREEILGEQLLKQLLTYIPTADEQAALMEQIENFDQFGKAEKFYVEVSAAASPLTPRRFLKFHATSSAYLQCTLSVVSANASMNWIR